MADTGDPTPTAIEAAETDDDHDIRFLLATLSLDLSRGFE